MNPRPALSGAALARLRHDLRTPINHILGYAEILIEDAGENGLLDFAPVFSNFHSGGQLLLIAIKEALDDKDLASRAQLETLEGKLRPDTTRLLEASISAAEKLKGIDGQPGLPEVEHIASAFRRLLALSSTMIGAEEPASDPIVSAQTSVAPPPSPPQVEREDGAGRILIVEDNSANRDLLRRRLEREGHRTWEASHGAHALQLLSEGEFDLLLLDVMMPEMDGFEVLARLKDDPRLRDLPVIMISALDEIQSVVRCIEMGAEDYLTKPFDPVLLGARIGASLEKKRLRDRERRKTEELEEALQRLRETQDQLVVQEKMASLGALTAGIAHEIKNPLNFVTNFAELSAELLDDVRQTLEPVRPALNAEDAAYLEELIASLTSNLQKIREHGKRADSIVRGMLAHSRGVSGQRETVDLNALIAEALNLAYHGLRAHDSTFNIALENSYDQTIPPVSIVSQDLSRVILNIANNAFYAAHQKKLKLGEGFAPTVRVITRDASDNIEIRIRDNGTGIPKDALSKIFNPFFTTKPTGSGTGLGLSLSYQIVVDQHGGTIQVETQQGEFTEFVITLPKNRP